MGVGTKPCRMQFDARTTETRYLGESGRTRRRSTGVIAFSAVNQDAPKGACHDRRNASDPEAVGLVTAEIDYSDLWLGQGGAIFNFNPGLYARLYGDVVEELGR